MSSRFKQSFTVIVRTLAVVSAGVLGATLACFAVTIVLSFDDLGGGPGSGGGIALGCAGIGGFAVGAVFAACRIIERDANLVRRWRGWRSSRTARAVALGLLLLSALFGLAQLVFLWFSNWVGNGLAVG